MSPNLKTSGRIAAFFDMDGTLIPEPSLEKRLFSKLWRSGVLPWANFLRWGIEAARLLPQGLLAVRHGNKRYLAGVSSDLVFRHVDSIAFFEEGIARVAWHARQGHEIVLISGTPEILALLAAMALECELEARGMQVKVQVCATRLSEDRGRWTGYIVGEAPYGQAKGRATERIAAEEELDLQLCHAYGNSLLDRRMLSAVGHPHVVNPGKDLAALANQRDWPIWHWHLEKKLDSNANTAWAAGIQRVERQA